MYEKRVIYRHGLNHPISRKQLFSKTVFPKNVDQKKIQAKFSRFVSIVVAKSDICYRHGLNHPISRKHLFSKNGFPNKKEWIFDKFRTNLFSISSSPVSKHSTSVLPHKTHSLFVLFCFCLRISSSYAIKYGQENIFQTFVSRLHIGKWKKVSKSTKKSFFCVFWFLTELYETSKMIKNIFIILLSTYLGVFEHLF